MSNFLYDSARSAFVAGNLDWDDDSFKVYLLTSGYTGDRSADVYVSDLPGGAILGTPTALTACTVLAGGILDAADVSYPDVAMGEIVERIVIAQDTGDTATSLLVVYVDTFEDTTPIYRVGDGANIPIVWPDTTTRIAKL